VQRADVVLVCFGSRSLAYFHSLVRIKQGWFLSCKMFTLTLKHSRRSKLAQWSLWCRLLALFWSCTAGTQIATSASAIDKQVASEPRWGRIRSAVEPFSLKRETT
jgi:hypothetical protein